MAIASRVASKELPDKMRRLRLVITRHCFLRLRERLGRRVTEIWDLRGHSACLMKNHVGWELVIPGIGRLAGKCQGAEFIACTFLYPSFRRCQGQGRFVEIVEVKPGLFGLSESYAAG